MKEVINGPSFDEGADVLTKIQRLTDSLTDQGKFTVLHPNFVERLPEEVKEIINENDCWIVKAKLG